MVHRASIQESVAVKTHRFNFILLSFFYIYVNETTCELAFQRTQFVLMECLMETCDVPSFDCV